MAQLVRQRTNNLDTLKICGFETRAYPYTFFLFFNLYRPKNVILAIAFKIRPRPLNYI